MEKNHKRGTRRKQQMILIVIIIILILSISTIIINAIPNIKDVEPMSYCLDNMKCHLNNDEAEATVPIEELLRNSGKTVGREVEVVKVVGENA